MSPLCVSLTCRIVDPEEMTKIATADVGEMLRGQATGVRVTVGNPGVGQSSNITIRGQASLTNNSPLIIVDGVQVPFKEFEKSRFGKKSTCNVQDRTYYYFGPTAVIFSLVLQTLPILLFCQYPKQSSI